jgi:membrane protein DedA with SNARE-associated domain
LNHIHDLVISAIDHTGYVGLFLVMTLANIGAPVGAEIVLPVAGALTAAGHLPNLFGTIAVAVGGELAGGSIGYAVGRFGGVPVIERYGKYVRFHHSQLERVHAFFERWGSFAIFICRFVPVIRGIVAIPAGIAEMNLVHFYLWTVLGSAIFCGGLVYAGDALGPHVNDLLPHLRRGGIIVLAVAVIAVVAVVLLQRARSKRARVVG